MSRNQKTWARVGAISGDLVALGLLWVLCVWARSLVHVYWLHPVGVPAHLPLVLLVAPLWVSVLALEGGYARLRVYEPSVIAVQLLSSIGGALLVALALLFALKLDYVSRTVVVGYAVASLPTLVLTRWLRSLVLVRSGWFHLDPHRVLLVGARGEAEPFCEAVRRNPGWGIEITRRCNVDEVSTTLREIEVDEVYLTGSGLGLATLQQIASLCDDLGLRLSMDANFLGVRSSSARIVEIEGWSVLTFTTTTARSTELVVKRLADVFGAGLGLLLLAPVMGLIAAIIRAWDGGPALFVQERAGLYGRTFSMYKFRSMVVSAEEELEGLRGQNEADGPVFKIEDDPRITPLGRFLRKSSLDELPQLYNVLMGEMSLVGPRPPIPDEVRAYERWQLRRLSMRPGLTCIWQVSGRSNLTWDRWMELDLQYIDNWSLWMDLRLLLQTVPAVLSGDGAR